MEKFGKFMASLLSLIIMPIINGFVFTKLWLWFIVPIFQMQPLRVVEAIGILILFNFITSKYDKDSETDEIWQTFVTKLGFTVTMAIFALLTGWIVTLFI